MRCVVPWESFAQLLRRPFCRLCVALDATNSYFRHGRGLLLCRPADLPLNDVAALLTRVVMISHRRM